jgi:NAD(P)-dependent dehydrogenase (short-subunit alcohol dehydrogenase family)
MTNWTLVTGASRHLGAHIAEGLAKEGKAVVIHYNKNQDEANKVLQKCKAYGASAEIIQGDFSNLNSVQKFIKEYQARFSDTQNIIHNVGPYFIGNIQDTPSDVWQEMMQTNFFAPVFITQALMKNIQERKGSVISLGVVGLNSQKAEGYAPAYFIAKAALWNFTKSLALELKNSDVRVNMVSPSYLEESIDQPKDINHMLFQRTVYFQEIVDVILFLFSQKACMITGQNIEVSGGIRL